jgi:hypothetical protein
MLSQTKVLTILADGCSWGEEPKEAAYKSVKIFIEYLKQFQRELLTADIAPQLMLRAYMSAHESIIEDTNQETLFQAGTTTMYASSLPLRTDILVG